MHDHKFKVMAMMTLLLLFGCKTKEAESLDKAETKIIVEMLECKNQFESEVAKLREQPSKLFDNKYEMISQLVSKRIICDALAVKGFDTILDSLEPE